MTLTATRNGFKVSATSLSGLCSILDWEYSEVSDKKIPFHYDGFDVSASQLVSKGVYALVTGSPTKRASAVSRAKEHLGYTPSMRPIGETCNTCAARVVKIGDNGKSSDWCSLGDFSANRKNGGCEEWKQSVE